MVEGECIRIGNLIPKMAISSQKAALRESKFKRYDRRRVHTQRKFDSQNGHFEPESSFTGIKFQEVEGKYIHTGNLIPKTAISSQKAALRESNFKMYGRRRVYTHRKFDSQNGPFEPESSFTGIKFQEVW